MKSSILAILLVSAGLGPHAFAQNCPDFSGEYVNVTDSAHPKVKIIQSGCDAITYIDNAGIEWKINMSGGESSPMPEEARREFANIVPDGSMSGNFAKNNTAELNASAHMKLPLIPGGKPLEVDVEAKATAALSGGALRDIQLSFDRIKIVKITSGSEMIDGGETNGFLQGVNWVIDLAKHALDLELHGI